MVSVGPPCRVNQIIPINFFSIRKISESENFRPESSLGKLYLITCLNFNDSIIGKKKLLFVSKKLYSIAIILYNRFCPISV
jgi:hypothetical protein